MLVTKQHLCIGFHDIKEEAGESVLCVVGRTRRGVHVWRLMLRSQPQTLFLRKLLALVLWRRSLTSLDLASLARFVASES